jgi:hypothetical protein
MEGMVAMSVIGKEPVVVNLTPSDLAKQIKTLLILEAFWGTEVFWAAVWHMAPENQEDKTWDDVTGRFEKTRFKGSGR